jgi:hypothetical protein
MPFPYFRNALSRRERERVPCQPLAGTAGEGYPAFSNGN